MIKCAFMDLDSVAYLAACVAEKKMYLFKHKETGETTKTFKNAKEAKQWYYESIEFGDIEEDAWERQTVVKELTLKETFQILDNEVKSWLRTAKRLTKNSDIICKGYLTSSGIKNKDIAGLEDRYQFNRYLNTSTTFEGWIPRPKPKFLSECRDYLIKRYGWVKMSPKGIEADAPVVFFTEAKGKEAVLMSKDKDLKQVMNSFFIDMNPPEKDRKLEFSTILGELSLVDTPSGKELKGCGFKLLCAQTVKGDQSDGYKGIYKVGDSKVYELLDKCITVEECLEALIRFYNEKFPEGYTYTSWDDKTQHRTPEELLKQHMRLAYHERGMKDKMTPIERYLFKENPIFLHGKLT